MHERHYPTLALILLGMLVVLIYFVIEPFIIPLLWAAILAFATWPVYRRLRSALGGSSFQSALFLTLTLGGAVIIPLIGATVLLREEVGVFWTALPEWLAQRPTLSASIAKLPYVGPELEELVGKFDNLQGLLRERALPWLRPYFGDLLSVLGGVGYNLAKLFIALLSLFFVYLAGPRVADRIRVAGLAVLGPSSQRYFDAVQDTIRAVVYGIVLTALAQGFLAGLGYWAVGLQAPISLGAVTAAFSILPFGTPLVWGSASVWLLFHDRHWAGIGLALWGGLVVSWIDNIIRPIVISNTAQIPFLLVLFGVLGGLSRFGLIGLFLGPIILATGLAVWREWDPDTRDSRSLDEP